MNFTSSFVPASNGDFEIRWGLYSQQSTCNRYVLFVNGRSEWIEKYHDLPALLNLPKDCGFLTLDHRGQGASGGIRGDVETYDHYVEDLKTVVDQVIGDAPYVALAHSMGGLILSLAVLQDKLHPQSMVLASPFFGLPRASLPPGFVNRLAKTLHSAGLGKRKLGIANSKPGRFKRNRLTHDRGRFEAMQACPYPVPSATIQWIAESVKAIETIHQPKLLEQLSIPTLVMIGSKETVVDRTALGKWASLAQSLSNTDIKYHQFKGSRHELFSESDEIRLPAIKMTRQWFGKFLDTP